MHESRPDLSDASTVLIRGGSPQIMFVTSFGTKIPENVKLAIAASAGGVNIDATVRALTTRAQDGASTDRRACGWDGLPPAGSLVRHRMCHIKEQR